MAAVSARSIEQRFAQMEGSRSRPVGPAPTPEAATKHQQDNTKRIKMLRDTYSAKHERLMKQTAHLADVKKKLDEVDSITASEIEILQKKIGETDREVHEAEKETQRIEEMLQKAKEDLEKRKQKKHLLTEHLCLIISETEKEKSTRLATLYRQLEFEEQEVKEARKDLVAAIALEAQKSSEMSSVLESSMIAQRNSERERQQIEGVPPQPAQQQKMDSVKKEGENEIEKEESESPPQQEGYFSGLSWGVEAVSGAVTGAVTGHVNSLISSQQDQKEDSKTSSAEKEEEEREIPMDQLFEGFSAEELSELMK